MSSSRSTSRSRVAFTARGPRRATRPLRPLAAISAAVVLGAVGLAAVGLPEAATDPSVFAQQDPTATSESRPSEPPAVADGDEQDGPPIVATVGRTRIALPSPTVTFIGFHEAASSDALTLTVTAPLTADMTYRGVERTTTETSDLGARQVVALPSRGRANGATSAIDLVLPADAAVVAPVTGTVVEVEPYTLYSRHPDVKIGIVPDDSPTHQVTIIHIEDPQVAVGQHVVAGETVIAARPNALPFGSQVDRFTARHGERPNPHVHIEVKPHRR